ncbi:carbonic anhydrase [Mycobacterium paraterrae]|uniref:carbonic anhydrase n=1 Tax=Mycobacterium paraterrae TaxID=577492 RepID=A0ABY3VK64_9MYCO|nr:carbonic anhydrase [Mycobacterium paraterrae]UMB67893.1 hypothetical protein MKK62_15535 [Mycobacterium paraterrae]
MDNITTYLDGNSRFADTHFAAGLGIAPARKTLLLGCLDPRVNPSQIFDLTLGDVGIIRNVGGRVTPAVIEQIALLTTLSAVLGGKLGPGWDLVLLQHTDCGITRLQEPPDQLAHYFGVDVSALPGKHVNDPAAAIAADIAALRSAPQVPSSFTVTGLSYDVADGRVTTVADSAPLRAA